VPAVRVAEICQLALSDIYRAHTPEMGSPGHFIYPEGATGQSYTLDGLCALVDGLRANGHDLEARILAVEIGGLRQAPSACVSSAPPARSVAVQSEVKSWALQSEQRLDEIQGGQAV
jgi:hypothetical protein